MSDDQASAARRPPALFAWLVHLFTASGAVLALLVLIEIDRERYETALENFRSAGLADYVDARLADAHDLVPKLAGPFDFVFSDADKEWSINYLKAVLPRLGVGGCFVAHNVTEEGGGWQRDYLRFLRTLPQFETIFDDRGAGMAISFLKGK